MNRALHGTLNYRYWALGLVLLGRRGRALVVVRVSKAAAVFRTHG